MYRTFIFGCIAIVGFCNVALAEYDFTGRALDLCEGFVPRSQVDECVVEIKKTTRDINLSYERLAARIKRENAGFGEARSKCYDWVGLWRQKALQRKDQMIFSKPQIAQALDVAMHEFTHNKCDLMMSN